eukprot:GABV01008926.1.p2 GENE.GABV01008926.1~~GABV01008926.1.p2  ORF type:complete len:136 (+),score=24.21 GABV01008926.1:289-696(+)
MSAAVAAAAAAASAAVAVSSSSATSAAPAGGQRPTNRKPKNREEMNGFLKVLVHPECLRGSTLVSTLTEANFTVENKPSMICQRTIWCCFRRFDRCRRRVASRKSCTRISSQLCSVGGGFEIDCRSSDCRCRQTV